MTNTATKNGRTLYRFEMTIGRTPRTCEQWHLDLASAKAAADMVLEDWRGSKRGRVNKVYPVIVGEAVSRGILAG